MTNPSEPQGILTTLYVSEILPPEKSLAHMRTKKPVPVAVEFMTREVAEHVYKQLQEHLSHEWAGAVRVTMLADLSHV